MFMKKAIKVAGIILGVFAFSEACGIIGETQALWATNTVNSKTVDEVLYFCEKPELCGAKGYTAFKMKMVGKLTKWFIKHIA